MCILCVCAQSCPTLCDPMDCHPSGSSVHGIFQARVLEWVAISSSRGSSQPRNQTCMSCIAGGFFTCCSGKPCLYMSDIPDRVSAMGYYVSSSNRMLKYLLIKQFFHVFKMLLAFSSLNNWGTHLGKSKAYLTYNLAESRAPRKWGTQQWNTCL